MTSDRIRIYESEAFTIELEYTREHVIWHTARVGTFTRRAAKELLGFADQLKSFLSLHYDVLYTAIPPDRQDLVRLAQHGGFTYLSTQDGLEVWGANLR